MASVASSTTSASLVSENARRGSLIIANDDANRLYVLLGAGTASSTNYSFSLAQNENACVPGYTGAAQGVWAADGSGSAYITEIGK